MVDNFALLFIYPLVNNEGTASSHSEEHQEFAGRGEENLEIHFFNAASHWKRIICNCLSRTENH